MATGFHDVKRGPRMRRRTSRVITLLLLLAAAASAQTRVIELRRGLVITSSVRIRPNVYRLAAPASLDSALIVIRGNDIVVDFSEATLEGIAPAADPDLAAGVAIRVDGGRNITI